jgi:PAS domain S-box-containing protein
MKDVNSEGPTPVVLTQEALENFRRQKFESNLSPDRDIGNLDLADIIDAPPVQSLMDDFYELARIPMSIIDLNGKVLVGKGWQDVCLKFHRVHPETCRHCVKSDLQLSGGISAGEFKLYRCRNRMWDMATPIMEGGKHLGNVFMGQFFFDDEELDYETFRSQARQYGFDEEEYITALEDVPRLSRKTVERGMAYLMKFADLISKLSYSNVKSARSLAERDVLMGSLVQAKEEWERTFDAVPDLIAILDERHRVVRANRAMAERLGMTPDQCTGKVCYEVVHGLGCAPEFCPHVRTLADGREAEAEVHESRLGGDFLVTTTPLTDEEGRRVGTVHVARDITDRKRAEEALRESEERLNRAQEIAHLGSWELDLLNNSLTWSDEVYRIFGLRPQEFAATYEAFLESVHPDDRAAVDAAYSSSLHVGKDTYEIEHRVIRKLTGEVRVVHEKCEHIRDESGRVIRSVGMVHDITEQIRFEDEIKRRIAVRIGINMILDQALKCGTDEDVAGAALTVAQELTGSRFGFIGEIGPEGLMHDIAISDTGWEACAMHDRTGRRRPPGSFHVHGIYGRVLKDGKSIITNDPASHPDSIGTPEGHPPLAAFLGVPLLLGDRTIGMIGVGNRDGGYGREELDSLESVAPAIVEALYRKRAEEALQRAHDELELKVEERTAELREKDQMLLMQSRQAAMGEMIGNIAHQWRQPLNALSLIVQTLPLMREMGELSQEYLESIEERSMGIIKHMSQTIDDFRNYFRPDKEKLPFTLGQAVSRTLSLIEDSFKNRPIAVEVVKEEDPVITGYLNEYCQVLLNILINARDAFPEEIAENAKVVITMGTDNGRAVVTIADNAGGISDDVMDKIFDPYFTTKGPDKGTGVGLFMSKAIIEKNMGGRLTARNTGCGAEFRIEVL